MSSLAAALEISFTLSVRSVFAPSSCAASCSYSYRGDGQVNGCYAEPKQQEMPLSSRQSITSRDTDHYLQGTRQPPGSHSGAACSDTRLVKGNKYADNRQNILFYCPWAFSPNPLFSAVHSLPWTSGPGQSSAPFLRLQCVSVEGIRVSLIKSSLMYCSNRMVITSCRAFSI